VALLAAAGAIVLTVIGGEGAPGQAVKEAVKATVKAAPAPPQIDEAFVKQVEQQYAAQFRQLCKSELHFMRMVTEPTRQQFEKIATEAEAGKKGAARAFALQMRGLSRNETDPRSPITDAIAKSVKENLSPEQAARYQKELDERVAFHKRLFVNNLVAMVDRLLILRPDQREQIGKVLRDNWDESWQMQILMYGGQYLPTMPDAKITPILTDAQRQVWRGIAKNNVRFGVGGLLGFVQGMEIEDEVWDDGPPKKGGNKPPPPMPAEKAPR
jgi:hypothetical protein